MRLRKKNQLVPIRLRKDVDCETPVSLFQKLRSPGPSFLLESVEGQEKWARYSFIGLEPLALFRSKGDRVHLDIAGRESKKRVKDPRVEDPFKELEKLFHSYSVALDSSEVSHLPRFFGGAVGYLSYDMVRFFEKLPRHGRDDLQLPDSIFMIPRVLLIFDNIRHTLEIVGFAERGEEKKVEARLKEISEKIDQGGSGWRGELPRQSGEMSHRDREGGQGAPTKLNWSPAAFQKGVRRVKEYILAGDVTQTVLSLRESRDYSGDPFHLYRSLRRLNPSPYMFFFDFGDLQLVGASPETMVRLEEGQLTLRPIAGTRPRDPDPIKDAALEKELLNDPKEKAEHIMLVDLGRNDLGRVARTKTVTVDQLMIVERYSHVRHLVSNVRAELADGKNAFDVIRATFPAGTLSGSPKIRAMEIIEDLEPTHRGPYGGCVGYFGFSGNMDMAITIRSAVIHNGRIHIQAGAGIVADSDPGREYEECRNKAKGVLDALDDR